MKRSLQNRLKNLRSKASKLAKNQQSLLSLVDSGKQKAAKNKRVLGRVWNDLSVLFRLLKAYAQRKYKDVEWQSIVLTVAGVLYFINPMDLIPDFLIGGFVDDGLVLGWVLASVQHELVKFKRWEKTRK